MVILIILWLLCGICGCILDLVYNIFIIKNQVSVINIIVSISLILFGVIYFILAIKELQLFNPIFDVITKFIELLNRPIINKKRVNNAKV